GGDDPAAVEPAEPAPGLPGRAGGLAAPLPFLVGHRPEGACPDVADGVPVGSAERPDLHDPDVRRWPRAVREGSVQGGQDIVGDVEVGVDVLYYFRVLQGVQEAEHLLCGLIV